MKRATLCMLLAMAPLACAQDGWISLFNGRNLDGWYTFLQTAGKDVAQTRGMVTVEEGLLHIMGNQASAQNAEAGYLATSKTGSGPASRTSVALTHDGRHALEIYATTLRGLLNGVSAGPASSGPHLDRQGAGPG